MSIISCREHLLLRQISIWKRLLGPDRHKSTPTTQPTIRIHGKNKSNQYHNNGCTLCICNYWIIDCWSLLSIGNGRKASNVYRTAPYKLVNQIQLSYASLPAWIMQVGHYACFLSAVPVFQLKNESDEYCFFFRFSLFSRLFLPSIFYLPWYPFGYKFLSSAVCTYQSVVYKKNISVWNYILKYATLRIISNVLQNVWFSFLFISN